MLKLADDAPMRLKDAAEQFGLTVGTLRAEADRGNLAIYKIGRCHYTTPADIKDMVEKCRVDQRGRGFTLTRNANSLSSETDRVSSALAAARETAERLKNSSRNISVKSIAPSHRLRP